MLYIADIVSRLFDLSKKYGLTIVYIDTTDITVIARVRIARDIFIQVYVNTAKNKFNMALVAAGQRIYGIDNEGGLCHEHPVDNTDSHLPADRIEIEDFFEKSIPILKNKKFI